MHRVTGYFHGLATYKKALLLGLALALVFAWYVSGITTNPPGFYIDEAATATNAYSLYETGSGEFGHFLPLFLPVFALTPPLDYLGYLDPVQVYLIALLHFIFPPSYAMPRLVSATAMFVTSILIAVLAFRITRSRLVTGVIFAAAILTPWLFEMSRLAFGAALFPLAVTLLLYSLYRASRQARWRLFDCALVAVSLALVTYTYGVGRLLGPLFALGLLLFATSRAGILSVLKTWFGYAITLIPIAVFHFRNPNALTGRFNMTVGIVKPGRPYLETFIDFLGRYAANVDPWTVLTAGDPNLRHHLTPSAEILAATFAAAAVGVVIVLVRLGRDGWWRFLVFALIVAPIPSSLTVEAFHTLRLSAYPVCVLLLSVPLLSWLWTGHFTAPADGEPRPVGTPRRIVFAAIAVLIVGQGVWWHGNYAAVGAKREGYFDAPFFGVFDSAVAQPDRPIYLLDHTYYHALWRAKVLGIDESNFVRLPVGQRPPMNAFVLSMEEKCTNCEVVDKFDAFIAYRNFKAVKLDKPDANAADLSFPRGLAVDAAGDQYVTDTKNSRLRKFRPDGTVLMTFGTYGSGTGEIREPHGIAVDGAGKIYVTDSASHKLLRYSKAGEFEKEWTGPGFYGPRDLAVGPDQQLYIVDQGRKRIVQFDTKSEAFTVWSGAGQQLNDPTGIAVGGGEVFVADTGNGRILVFDLRGTYLREWMVPEWKNNVQYYPDMALDEVSGTLYVTVSVANELTAFDANGARKGDGAPVPAGRLRNPSSMAISQTPSGRSLLILNTVAGEPSDAEYKRVWPLPLTSVKAK